MTDNSETYDFPQVTSSPSVDGLFINKIPVCCNVQEHFNFISFCTKTCRHQLMSTKKNSMLAHKMKPSNVNACK